MQHTEITKLQNVVNVIADLVTRAGPDVLLNASPCAGWNGRDVLNHMVGAADLFAGPARGETMSFPDWSSMEDLLGNDPVTAYRNGVERVVAAYGAPGVLDGNVTMPWGEMPASFALNVLIADHVTHAWDLGRAAGVPVQIDDAVVDVALQTFRVSVVPELRAAGFYGPEQTEPPAATPLDRLAAFTGRSFQ
ncbi:MAG: TIGR03086 family metal-binding protein [Acidimicrobiales bacterium]